MTQALQNVAPPRPHSTPIRFVVTGATAIQLIPAGDGILLAVQSRSGQAVAGLDAADLDYLIRRLIDAADAISPRVVS